MHIEEWRIYVIDPGCVLRNWYGDVIEDFTVTMDYVIRKVENQWDRLFVVHGFLFFCDEHSGYREDMLLWCDEMNWYRCDRYIFIWVR